MENRTEKKTVSTVDMTTEVFKAMSQGSASSIRCLYQIAFSGRLLPKQKPEQHKDSTLTMLQHIEDPEAWEKIYKLVNVLWLKESLSYLTTLQLVNTVTRMNRQSKGAFLGTFGEAIRTHRSC